MKSIGVFWALHFPGNLRTDNRAGSLEAAKEQCEQCGASGRRGPSLEELP